MTYNEFQIILKNKNCYSNLPNNSQLMNKIPGLTSLYFYINVIKLFILASKTACREDNYFKYWGYDSYQFHQLVEKIGGKLNFSGFENLREITGPVVFIGNHMSSLETTLMPAFILPFTEATYVIKDSLTKYPYLGSLLTKVESVTVLRSNPKEDLKKVFDQAGNMLKNGRSIIIFPQQTRSVILDPKQFNSIGIKLAKKANVPILPFALKTDIWGNGKFFKDFGKIDIKKEVYVEFGKLSHIRSNGKENHKEVIEFIDSRLKSWGCS